jgi:transposase
METIYFLGIDMAKKSFQVALTVNGATVVEESIDNTEAGIKTYFEELKKKFNLSQLVVCVEHTGIYTCRLLDYLAEKKIRICLESAIQIQRSQGVKRGKNDRIDAVRIAQYAYKNFKELRFWTPSRDVINDIKSLLTMRDRLVKMKTKLTVPVNEEEGLINAGKHKRHQKFCAKTLSSLKGDIAEIDLELKVLINSDPQVKEQVKYATSVPGIGILTALSMIVYSGEFERIRESKKFACYAGVAPFEHSSGSSVRGKTRVSKMANMRMKRLLHLAAMSSINRPSELKTFYDRKVAEGKNKMSALNAVRNKLISRVFACVKNKHPYEKTYLNALA